MRTYRLLIHFTSCYSSIQHSLCLTHKYNKKLQKRKPVKRKKGGFAEFDKSLRKLYIDKGIGGAVWKEWAYHIVPFIEIIKIGHTQNKSSDINIGFGKPARNRKKLHAGMNSGTAVC
jgi:hypothetical protein